jgi:hypothetical protein
MANASDLGLGLREEPGCARTGGKLFDRNYFVFGHDRALALVQRKSQSLYSLRGVVGFCSSTLRQLEAGRVGVIGSTTPFPHSIGKKFTPIFPSPDHRWSHWTQLSADKALKHVKEAVFPFIKTLGGAGGSFAAQMENAEFKINKPSTAARRLRRTAIMVAVRKFTCAGK